MERMRPMSEAPRDGTADPCKSVDWEAEGRRLQAMADRGDFAAGESQRRG